MQQHNRNIHDQHQYINNSVGVKIYYAKEMRKGVWKSLNGFDQQRGGGYMSQVQKHYYE